MMAREKLGWLCGSLIVLASGCGGGGGQAPASTTSTAPVFAPAITTQPVNQSVPMGLTATYSVSASGTVLQYQWSKNGVAIPGANESTYVTPATGFADTGTSFTVTVTNSSGTVTSDAVTLTVTARAPAAGDLRFQLVDADLTVNGYRNAGAGLSTGLIRGGQEFSGSIGTPLFASPGDCSNPPQTNGTGCEWLFEVAPLAASLGESASGFTSGYASDLYAYFQSDVQSWPWTSATSGPLVGTAPFATSSVVNSIDFEPANILFGLSWIQSSQQTGFQMTLFTAVPAADLQSTATTEGANGHVITAISYDAGAYDAGASDAGASSTPGITFLSYGWQADTSTIYEAQVATATPANAAAAAANLASQGYIITALGLGDSAGDIVMVGTRVQGDTMSRPFMSVAEADNSPMFQQGYATVGVIAYPSPTDANTYITTFLGER
jgi:hypothetical protein